jgi:hypothetical protein
MCDIGVCNETLIVSVLKSVARKRLVKRQQAGKGLAGAVVICRVWRSTMAL